jgi:hypothetical protein
MRGNFEAKDGIYQLKIPINDRIFLLIEVSVPDEREAVVQAENRLHQRLDDK